MPGFMPGIHVVPENRDVDGRDNSLGHNDNKVC
jgi:hypothetical protein